MQEMKTERYNAERALKNPEAALGMRIKTEDGSPGPLAIPPQQQMTHREAQSRLDELAAEHLRLWASHVREAVEHEVERYELEKAAVREKRRELRAAAKQISEQLEEAIEPKSMRGWPSPLQGNPVAFRVLDVLSGIPEGTIRKGG